MVIKMQINQFHYNVLTVPQKIYIDLPTVKIREKLNIEFKSPIISEDGTGIFGKFTKLDKLYKIKYIYGISKQNQPQNFERYHYLLDVNCDENGSYVEYALVYDKLYDPLIRLVYILAVCAVMGYLYYSYLNNVMGNASVFVLGSLVLASVFLVFKKHKENENECKNAERYLKDIIQEFIQP